MGESLAERKNLGQEIGSDHWPKKPYFRRFPANLPRKLWPGLTFCSSAGDALGSGPLDSCCGRSRIEHPGDIGILLLLHDRHAAIAIERLSTLQG